jgi:hypothetical protein
LVESLSRQSIANDQLLDTTAEDYIDVINLNPVRDSGAPLLPENPQNKYCESESDDSNLFEYRFAKHSRFVLWLYNLHFRHRTLSQGKIYIRQCPTDAIMPITELQSLIDRPVF